MRRHSLSVTPQTLLLYGVRAERDAQLLQGSHMVPGQPRHSQLKPAQPAPLHQHHEKLPFSAWHPLLEQLGCCWISPYISRMGAQVRVKEMNTGWREPYGECGCQEVAKDALACRRLQHRLMLCRTHLTEQCLS